MLSDLRDHFQTSLGGQALKKACSLLKGEKNPTLQYFALHCPWNVCVLNLVAVPLWMQCVLSRGGKCVELLNPLGAITGIADAGNRFIVKNNTLE